METLMAIVIGILFSIGTYLILCRGFVKIIIGTSILSHGIHLLILTIGGLKENGPPLLGEGFESFTDPIPQALILTAIVINFAVTSLFLVLAYKTYKENNTADMNELRGLPYE